MPGPFFRPRRARLLRWLADLLDFDTLDLFAGPGGWDLAAHTLGLRPLGVEWDPSACATREAASLRTLQADVAELDPALFAGLVRVLIGSPPCPTFSAAGGGAGRHLTAILVRCLQDLAAGRDTREAARALAFDTLRPVAWEAERVRASKQKREPSREQADTRARRDADMSVLVVEPLRFALELQPESIALEQVPAVLPLWQVMAGLLETAGYSVWAGVLEAERFGVPQTRERAVLIASRVRAVHPPEPTHHRYVPNAPRPERVEGLFGSIEPYVTMAEALGWVGHWQVRTRGDSGREHDEFPVDAPSRAITGKSGSWTYERPANARRVRALGNTKGGTRPDGLTREGDEPAPTITSRADQLQVEDPAVVRVTVQEAAILQTFPAGYPWQGTKTAQFQQVGNAVPPLLALRVLEAVV